MVAMVLSILGFALFLAMLTGLYVWTRRTEAEVDYGPTSKSEEQAGALRLGIALNSAGSTGVAGR